MKRLFARSLIILLLAGCGKKGALIPPEALAPAPVADLTVVQKGEPFQVSWTRPAKDERGAPLRDLAGFRVLRREVLPAGEDCEQCPGAYRTVRESDLEYLRGVLRLGDRFFFADRDPVVGKTYRYKIISTRSDGSASRESTSRQVTKIVPPPAPAVTARSIPGAIEISWDRTPLPTGMLPLGYNIYRRAAGGQFPPFPVNDRPVTEPRYEDRHVEMERTYGYQVRTVVRAGNGVAESEPSREVQAVLRQSGPDEGE